MFSVTIGEKERKSQISVFWLPRSYNIQLPYSLISLCHLPSQMPSVPFAIKYSFHAIPSSCVFSCASSAHLAEHCLHTFIKVVPSSCDTLFSPHYTQLFFTWLTEEISSLMQIRTLLGIPLQSSQKYNTLISFFCIHSSHPLGTCSLFKPLGEHHSIGY